jgi:hypothetical protein
VSFVVIIARRAKPVYRGVASDRHSPAKASHYPSGGKTTEITENTGLFCSVYSVSSVVGFTLTRL